MVNYRTSRIVPIILVIIIMIIAIAALVSLARVVFFSGTPSTPTVDAGRESLLNTSADRRVTMTVRGPIVADERFYSYEISISPSERRLTTYNGYRESVVDQLVLPNNTAAYEEFVYALDKADLAVGTPLTGERDDTRGICATGRVYEFAIINGNETVERLWTSTCRGSAGSLDASVDQLTGLFSRQIPDAATLLKKIDL